MPREPSRACRIFGCPNTEPCAIHKRLFGKNLTAKERGYTAAWERLSKRWLARHPLCLKCNQAGLTVAATAVDHIRPHRGDLSIVFDTRNLQSLCASCHAKKSGTEQMGDNVQPHPG